MPAADDTRGSLVANLAAALGSAAPPNLIPTPKHPQEKGTRKLIPTPKHPQRHSVSKAPGRFKKLPPWRRGGVAKPPEPPMPPPPRPLPAKVIAGTGARAKASVPVKDTDPDLEIVDVWDPSKPKADDGGELLDGLTALIEQAQKTGAQSLQSISTSNKKLTAAVAKERNAPNQHWESGRNRQQLRWRLSQGQKGKSAKGKGKGKGKAKAATPVPPPPPPATVFEVPAAEDPAASTLGDLPKMDDKGARKIARNAELASQKYSQGEEPAAKRMKTEGLVSFADDVLSAVPGVLQTCRSFMLFLNKKLESPGPEPPAITIAGDGGKVIEGDAAFRGKLQAYADQLGMLQGLRTEKWESRVKRIFDVPAAVKKCGALLAISDMQLEAEADELRAKFQDNGVLLERDALNAAVSERREWASVAVQREVLKWCVRLLKSKETCILAAEGSEEHTRIQTSWQGQNKVTMAGVLEAVLSCSLAG